MGLHVGRVYADRDDLLGETVNVAARLERLAETGGICVSGQLRKYVRGCSEPPRPGHAASNTCGEGVG